MGKTCDEIKDETVIVFCSENENDITVHDYTTVPMEKERYEGIMDMKITMIKRKTNELLDLIEENVDSDDDTKEIYLMQIKTWFDMYIKGQMPYQTVLQCLDYRKGEFQN